MVGKLRPSPGPMDTPSHRERAPGMARCKCLLDMVRSPQDAAGGSAHAALRGSLERYVLRSRAIPRDNSGAHAMCVIFFSGFSNEVGRLFACCKI